MVVSSNTLFQFTGNLDTLVKILSSAGFWPRYCIEFGWREKLAYDFAVPQCCFCDIPLSAIQSHMGFYGEYAIGMTKDWGIEKGISPVMYVIPNSHLVKIINGIRKAAKGVADNTKFFAFLKCYRGVNYRLVDGDWIMRKNYLYYDEREWRYVPSELSAKEMIIRVDKKEVFDADTLSQNTKAYLCSFKAKDVRYMIVKNEDERISLVQEIENLTNWSEPDKNLLKSIILTHALIKEDI